MRDFSQVLMRGADFEKALKSSPAAGYLLFGDEDYMKNHALEQARAILCPDPALAFFNDMRLDALTFTPGKLLDALMPMPMMTDRKLVTLTGLSPSQMTASEFETLCDTIAALDEYDYNTFLWIVPSGGLDEGYLPKRPSSALQKLSEHLVPVRFERNAPQKLVGWASKHFAHRGTTAPAEVCKMIVDYCGTDMYTLANEIDKVAFYVLSHGRNAVCEEDVRVASNPTVEFDTFAFSGALLDRRYDTALAVLGEMKRRRVEPVMILGEVTRFFCDLSAARALVSEGRTAAEIGAILKIHEYRAGLYMKAASGVGAAYLDRAMTACAEADAALKQSPQGYTALERLLCTL